MSKVPAGHPDEGLLLRYADGELSARQAKRVQSHLEACWECRACLSELQRSIEECVGYRKAVLQACLPEPPVRWADIYGRLAAAEESLAARPWRRQLWEAVCAGAARPRRWAAAAALAATVWAVVDQLPRFRGLQPAAPPSPRMAASPAPPPPVAERRRAAVPSPRAAAELPAMEEATPGDELRVFTVLRRLGADLGEPVEVKRGRERVLVTGVGIDPQRQQQIGEALRAVPRVAVNFSDPAAAPLPSGGRAPDPISVRPEVARLQADLESHLGGRAAFEEFGSGMLEMSDELMSRAHALRRLAERFPPETEAALSGRERQTLRALRREHAATLARLAVNLERRAWPALRPLRAGAEPAPVPAAGGPWQAATEQLFQEAREAEASLAALLAGAAGEDQAEALPGHVLTHIASLRAAAEAFVILE
jgi:hypothetical protein